MSPSGSSMTRFRSRSWLAQREKNSRSISCARASAARAAATLAAVLYLWVLSPIVAAGEMPCSLSRGRRCCKYFFCCPGFRFSMTASVSTGVVPLLARFMLLIFRRGSMAERNSYACRAAIAFGEGLVGVVLDTLRGRLMYGSGPATRSCEVPATVMTAGGRLSVPAEADGSSRGTGLASGVGLGSGSTAASPLSVDSPHAVGLSTAPLG
mmetsp:Transcript_87624/g.152545  ORF Transcript_87624/g.152545 Transcript_87624/m.152545 type:complete len:210 (-) Transcript_87624:486-1115(-)